MKIEDPASVPAEPVARASASGPSRLALPIFLVVSAAAWIAGVAASQPTTSKPPTAASAEKTWKPKIPKTWDEGALATLDVPLADPSATPEHVPAEYYYRIPEKTVFKSYPVYHPDHEPQGYLERLKKLDAEIAFDPARLKTRADWIAAGEVVFDAALVYDALNSLEEVRDRAWYERTSMPVARDGTVPFFRYVVVERGEVRLGELGCGACHTRVMDDGSVVKGAQGNYPLALLDALDLEERAERAEDREAFRKQKVRATRASFGAPWLGPNDPAARYAELSPEESYAIDASIPPGAQARFGTSSFHPVQVPDLIGLEKRRYFGRTGYLQHRSIGDLMRYAAIHQGMGSLDSYGGFIPAGSRPEPDKLGRYSDAQLYALSLYLYSLEPPPNPNPFDELAARGKKIFEREECWRCHKPPLYTNNKLTPVDGFEPAYDHPQARDILPLSVGTDPGLALYTRRGTGLYKVPSLLGVWYRGPFEHSGSVATLEDWFDKRRLRSDYVPTGFRGLAEKRAVPGHRFGLELSAEEKAALIAFMKTL